MGTFKVGPVEVQVGGATLDLSDPLGRAGTGEGEGITHPPEDQGPGPSQSSSKEGRAISLVGKIGKGFCSLKRQGKGTEAFRELELTIAENLDILVSGCLFTLDDGIKLMMDIEKFSRDMTKGGENVDKTPLDLFQTWLAGGESPDAFNQDPTVPLPTKPSSHAQPSTKRKGRPPKPKPLDNLGSVDV